MRTLREGGAPDMTHEELVEKVAMEIRARRDGAGCTPWQRINAAHKEPYRRDARAAISVVAAALREPTEEMVDAALRAAMPGDDECDMKWPDDFFGSAADEQRDWMRPVLQAALSKALEG